MIAPDHFGWSVSDGVATVTLTGAERKNPLTFESYAELRDTFRALAGSLASGPTFAHAMTKTMLDQEWAMSVEAAIESEAQAQAICMQTRDFERAYRAFLARERPVFEGD